MECNIDIPFGAHDSELKGWEYTIPEGMEAIIKDGKVIVKEKESEDESIRKWLIDYFIDYYDRSGDTFCGMQITRILAYLEKQKELPFVKDVMLGYPGVYFYDGERMHFRGNPAMEEKQKEQKPIFRTGDTLKKKGKEYTFTIDKIQGGFYLTKDEHFFPIEEQDTWELVEQKPTDEEYERGYEAGKRDMEREAFRNVDKVQYEKGFKDGVASVKPAEYGDDVVEEAEEYTSKVDCGEYGVAVTEAYIAGVLSERNRKPAEWSEEDERMIKRVIERIEAEIQYGDALTMTYGNQEIAWLKSLRPQPKQEWSKEQMEALNEIINTLAVSKHPHENDYLFNMLNGLRKNLKSLRPVKQEWSDNDEKTISDACCWIAEYAGYLMNKNYGKASMLLGLTDKLKSLRPSWKPSEEQMNALENVIKCELSAGLHTRARILQTLQNDLEKL